MGLKQDGAGSALLFNPLPPVLLGVYLLGRVGHEGSKKDQVQVCLNFMQNIPERVPGVASFIKLLMKICILFPQPLQLHEKLLCR